MTERCQICGETFDGNVEHHGKDAPAAMGGIPKHGFQPAEPLSSCERGREHEWCNDEDGCLAQPKAEACEHVWSGFAVAKGFLVCARCGRPGTMELEPAVVLPADVVAQVRVDAENVARTWHRMQAHQAGEEHMVVAIRMLETALAALPKEGE